MGYDQDLRLTTVSTLRTKVSHTNMRSTRSSGKITSGGPIHQTLCLDSNGIIVETKGRFVPADRRKHLKVKEQYPKLDIRFVFTNSKTKINKGSKTSYSDWCKRHGFLYADKVIPESWLEEPEVEMRIERTKE